MIKYSITSNTKQARAAPPYLIQADADGFLELCDVGAPVKSKVGVAVLIAIANVNYFMA